MKYSLFLTLALCGFTSCSQTQELRGYDLRLFSAANVWPLAQAVSKDDTVTIVRLLRQEKDLINYQEPKFGESLLLWAVWTNHFASAKSLLQQGANPNLPDTYHGITPLIYAADKYGTSAYVKLLLAHGADPNLVVKDSLEFMATPLIAAAYNRLESVKLLVGAGAKIDYEAPYQKSALRAALFQDRVNIVRYLILEKGANFKRPIGYTYFNRNPIKVTDALRSWTFPLHSRKYKEKMEIVNYLKENGEDYWKTNVPSQYQRHYSKEYLAKY